VICSRRPPTVRRDLVGNAARLASISWSQARSSNRFSVPECAPSGQRRMESQSGNTGHEPGSAGFFAAFVTSDSAQIGPLAV
jgi:hypothetical protein